MYIQIQHGMSLSLRKRNQFYPFYPSSTTLILAIWYIRSLYRHVVCNGLVSYKAFGDRSQLGAWLESNLIVEYYDWVGGGGLFHKQTF